MATNENPGPIDALRDAKARFLHEADQGQAATMALAQTIAGFFLGLATTGVPVAHAAYITGEYVKAQVAVIHNMNRDNPTPGSEGAR